MSSKLVPTFITALLCFCIVETATAQLMVGFYQGSCAFAEFVVKQEVLAAFINDKGVAAGLVRLHFHDCFVRGCDGSVLIDSTGGPDPAEKDSSANNPSLRGFGVVDSIKTRLEAMCPGVVSCADILAFAARDSIEITGGLGYDVPAGRRDGRVSSAKEASANLPAPTFNVNQLTQAFANKGLTQEEMVTLSGAHTLGRSHCTSFINRLYNFNSNSSSNSDPTLDAMYTNQLRQQCPQGSDASLVVAMDASPAISDVAYYRDVATNRGLFTSDQTLLTDQRTRTQVLQNAQIPFIWKSKFASAMVNMGKIEVLTGNSGEIRKNCRVINS